MTSGPAGSFAADTSGGADNGAPLSGRLPQRPTDGGPVSAAMIRRVVAVSVMTVASLAVGLGLAPGASSAPSFAPIADATIHPGVQMVTGGGQCTANFVFTQGDDVFIGYAAHCAGLGGQTDTDGCATESLPIGTPVEIQGATRPGVLAYSSWTAMRAVGETDPVVCATNDFAFVKVDPADHLRLSPTVAHWGGPSGVSPSEVPLFTGLRAYGRSGLRLGLTLVSPMLGVGLGTSYGGWSHQAFTLVPAVPGDSGMPLLDEGGRAVGLLSTITIFPRIGTLNFTDISLAMSYARSHGFPGLQLALGDPINLNQLPLDL